MSVETNPVRLSREEIAKREIGRTDISDGLAWLMTILFVSTLVAPPVIQLAHEIFQNETNDIPTCLALFRRLPDVVGTFERTKGSLWNRGLAANRRLLHHIEDFERQLEERSWLAQRLLGPTQNCLTEHAGLGNEKAYIGRQGWLYYRPDVDYLTGPGFLDAAVLRRRALSGKQHTVPPQPDPRPAIIEFHEQLARRGIRLIVVPTPGKSAIHPGELSSRFSGSTIPVVNASFRQFVKDLDDSGVLVFDPAPMLAHRKSVSQDAGQFLRTDSHWTPDAVQFIAERMKMFVEEHCSLPSKPPVDYRERIQEVTNLGDIAAMLHLPVDQHLIPAERAVVREVREPDGMPWEPDEAADVLLLGDSYTNIYSLPEMKWGTGAGLAERLSFELRRKVDRLAQNDGGSHAVRQALRQQSTRGHDRLRGKKVVIWEFAVRELAFGDWKRLSFPDRNPAAAPRDLNSPAASPGELLVHGTVRAAAGAPQPGSVPYREAVTALHLDSIETQAEAFPKGAIVVYLWGMRENRLLEAANFVPDQRVTLRLTPWETVRDKYERFNRIELEDPEFQLAELPTYWAEEAQ